MTVKCDYMGAIIGWKHNHQVGMSTVDGEITAFPGGIPSDDDINAWKTEYDAHVAATAYREKRATEYPEIGDQLDDLYRKGAFSDAMAAQLKAVKDKHPK
tara:strand:- start:166 stop:465 length:300 start_codon:yes stop_codon:yes gene_type:complete